MDFLELAKRRASVREYLQKPVENEKLAKILEAARVAPSAANFQPWHFVVVTSEENRQLVSSTYQRAWLKEAPVYIIACGDHNHSWKRSDGKDHCDIDVAIAIDHVTLAATELGLGSCWICNFDAKKCAEILALPANIEPVVILPIGYPAIDIDAERHHSLRKPLDKIIHWEKF
jgi:nitroreductase